MKDTKSDFNKDENAIEYLKPKARIFLYGFIFVFGLCMFIISLGDILDVLINGKLNFDIRDSYVVIMFSDFCLLLTIGRLLGYFGNKIFISGTFIIIKRAAIGKMYKVSQTCLLTKSVIFTSAKGIDDYKIFLYLKNGKRIGTGYLNCKGEEFEKIYNNFKCKGMTNKNAWKRERINSQKVKIGEDDLVIKNNYFFPLLTYFPLISLIIGAFLVASGFNYKYGNQENFHVRGIVTDKKIAKNKGNIYYKIVIKDSNTSEEYTIDVNRNTYDKYESDKKINIYGTKGSLGMLYDIYLQSTN
jgi:hypothetical protein